MPASNITLYVDEGTRDRLDEYRCSPEVRERFGKIPSRSEVVRFAIAKLIGGESDGSTEA